MPDTTTPQRPVARPPKPSYEGLFQEPVYADDGPYDRGDDDDSDR